MDDVKRIDIAEFRREGYLQEVNRQFFHPLGLALEVVVDDDGEERLGGVWDYRDDSEGISYGEGMIDPGKADRVQRARWDRELRRIAALGYVTQPIVPDVR